MLEEGGAGFVHVDVMDGHFVPNLSLGVPFVAQLKKITKLPLDVHLMISNPMTQLDWYLKAGADLVTVHYEAFAAQPDDLHAAIERIHAAGARAGLALKPDADPDVVIPFISKLDMVLMMSVYPGFSGQSYIEGTEDKIARIVAHAREVGACPLIQVDGGIGMQTIGRVAQAGADVIVCGNAVLKAESPKQAIADITRAAEEAR